MIVPTTILSLAALSAAESSSKRGLRKSSTPPWTAIAVISGTAVVGLGAGFGIGYLIRGSSGKAAAGADNGLCVQKNGFCTTGCAEGYYADALKSCDVCPENKNIATANFADPYETIDPATACAGCAKDYHQDGLTTCASNERGYYSTPTFAFVAAPTGGFGNGLGCKPHFYEKTAGVCAECPFSVTKRAENKPFNSPFVAPVDSSTPAGIKAHAVLAGCVAECLAAAASSDCFCAYTVTVAGVGSASATTGASGTTVCKETETCVKAPANTDHATICTPAASA